MGLRSLLISKLLPVAALILGLLIEIEAFIGIIIVMMMRFPFVSSVLVAVLFGQNGCGYGYGLLAKSKHRYLHSGTQAPKFGPRLFLLSSEMLKASLILFSVSLDSGFMPLALALAGT